MASAKAEPVEPVVSSTERQLAQMTVQLSFLEVCLKRETGAGLDDVRRGFML